MIELLRNCSHGSEIATYLVNDKCSIKEIIKATTTSNGIKNLKCEIDGWNWYQKRRYPQKNYPVCQIIHEKDSYLKIRIEFIEGSKADYKKGLEKNADILKKVIEHYCCIWPYYSNNMAPLHGDLSLDNVIYNSDGIHIVDWEHFGLTGAPWGFDALYLLFETLWFGMKNRKRPTQREINIISDNINYLKKNNELSSWITERPLKFIKDFITDNFTLWGDQLLKFPNKLPILVFTDKQISLIDGVICSK